MAVLANQRPTSADSRVHPFWQPRSDNRQQRQPPSSSQEHRHDEAAKDNAKPINIGNDTDRSDFLAMCQTRRGPSRRRRRVRFDETVRVHHARHSIPDDPISCWYTGDELTAARLEARREARRILQRQQQQALTQQTPRGGGGGGNDGNSSGGDGHHGGSHHHGRRDDAAALLYENGLIDYDRTPGRHADRLDRLASTAVLAVPRRRGEDDEDDRDDDPRRRLLMRLRELHDVPDAGRRERLGAQASMAIGQTAQLAAAQLAQAAAATRPRRRPRRRQQAQPRRQQHTLL